MDQGLKQQLVGAAVITALAAIFVPMLFDDTVDEAGKTVSELKIPEVPAKAQDVEILPLPEKQEEVATVEEAEPPKTINTNSAAASAKAAPVVVAEGEDEPVDSKPQLRLTDRETAVKPVAPAISKPKLEAAAVRAQAEDVSEDVDVRPVETVAKPVPPVTPVKPPKVVAKPLDATTPDTVAKPAASAATAETGNMRWYLNAGSFTQRENAVALHDNLKKQGFAVTIKEAASDKGTIFKVRIGPLLDKAKAQAMKVKLAQINVNSFVSGEE